MVELKPRKKNKSMKGKLILLLALSALLLVLVVVLFLNPRENASPDETLGPPGESQVETVTEQTQVPPELTEAQTVPEEASVTDAPTQAQTQTSTEQPDPKETEPAVSQKPEKPEKPAAGNEEKTDWVQPSGSTVVELTPATEPPPKETEPPEEAVLEQVEVTCDQYSLFDGQYMEDGRDELVYDVAAILVTNRSDRYLEIATFTYEIDGREATFVATGLHPGRSAWVLEQNRMTVHEKSRFTFVDFVTGFRDEVVTTTEKIAVTAAGNMMSAKNNTNAAIEDVFVYYKLKHEDGNYLGGITYRVDFGTLEAGATVTKLAGHYDAETAEVVRVSWKTE